MKQERLYSLDLLRGLDMLLLVVIGPMFSAINSSWPLPDCVMGQFHHNWGGFTLWDLIMPLFIFMCGSAVPFGLEKRKTEGRAGLPYWQHVLTRVAMLWIFGMVAQGRLLSMDVMLINPFNNTLQAIAAGYLVAAVVLAIPSKRVRIAAPFVLAIAYTVFLHFCGDYTIDGNAATRFERWMLALITPEGSKALEMADPGYSWWATIPMFGAMTLCGMAATNILMDESAPQTKRLARLSIVGASLLAFGWAASPLIPAIKHIYTLTFTAQAMGWCMLLLAALYFMADVFRLRRGTWLILLFGQTSLMAYMCHVFKPAFKAFGKMFAPGAAHLFGSAAEPIAAWLASSALLVVFLTLWRGRSGRSLKLLVLSAGIVFLLPASAADEVIEGTRTSLSGIVRDAFLDELDAHYHFFVIQNESGMHYATTKSPSVDNDYVGRLIGAEVTISGILDPASPPNRQYLGHTVFFDGTNAVQVIKPAPQNPFAVPEIEDFNFYSSEPANIVRFGLRRAHGRVFAVWQGRSILLERTGRVPFSRIELGECEPPKCGSFIEAVGYAETDLSSINLSRARWRPAPAESLPEPVAIDATARDLFNFNGLSAFNSTYYGKIVRLSGNVLTMTESGRFQIGDDGTPITIDVSSLPEDSQTPEIGSRIEITGVCILDLPNWRPNEVFPHARGLFLVVRTPEDIRILERPSWWTTGRLLAVILVLLGGLAAIVLWNLSLQVLVVRRARQLFKADLKRATSELRVKDRTRLAVELHDALSQSLTGVSMEVEAAIRHGTDNPQKLMRHLSVADKILKSCRNELRNSLWDLRNDALEERSLDEAIRRTLLPHVRDIALKVRFSVPRSLLTDNATHEILRIIRELAVNGISHGGATSIQVAGSVGGNCLLFSVRDNGTGFDPDDAPGVSQGHFGLEGVRERLRQLKGKLAFEPAAGGGMKATVTIPLPKNNS